MAQTSGVVRAALLGAGAAFVIGGAALIYLGIMAHYGLADCAELTNEECTFEHEGYKSVGRVQSIAGVAMFFLGLAVYVLFRRPPAVSEPVSQGSVDKMEKTP